MNYNEDIMIRVRVDRNMRDEFKAVATKNNTSMSDLIRGWINEYVATENTVVTNNDVATNDNVATENNLFDEKTLQVLKRLKVFEIRSDRIVRTYHPKQFIKKSFLNKDLFRIEGDMNE